MDDYDITPARVMTAGGRMRKAAPIIAALAAVTLSLAGCSSWAATHDHNTGVGPYVAHPNTVIEFPYNWDNVIRVCDHGDGIYEPRGSSVGIFVVPSDPACK